MTVFFDGFFITEYFHLSRYLNLKLLSQLHELNLQIKYGSRFRWRVVRVRYFVSLTLLELKAKKRAFIPFYGLFYLLGFLVSIKCMNHEPLM